MNDLDDDLGVDLTPLIDVTFMLVIFFLMTMSFTLPVIDFTLPTAESAQAQSQRATVRISVDASGSYMLNNNPCDEAALPSLLEAHVLKANEAGKELTIELVIDAHAPSQHLIHVADLSRLYTQGRLMVVSTTEPDASADSAAAASEASGPAAADSTPAPNAARDAAVQP